MNTENYKTKIIYIELIEQREAIMKKLNKFFALCLSLFCIFGMITPICAEGEGSTDSGFTELEKHDPDAPAEFMALKAWTDEGNGLQAIPRVEGTDENVYEYNLRLGIKQPISFNWWGTLADGAGKTDFSILKIVDYFLLMKTKVFYQRMENLELLYMDGNTMQQHL